MVRGSPQLTTLPRRYFAPCRGERAARARFYPDLLDLRSVFLNLENVLSSKGGEALKVSGGDLGGSCQPATAGRVLP